MLDLPELFAPKISVKGLIGTDCDGPKALKFERFIDRIICFYPNSVTLDSTPSLALPSLAPILSCVPRAIWQ